MNQKITLQIRGMDCASCAASIEHNLKKAKGVISASVNFAAENAFVEFDPKEIEIKSVKKIITDLGYKIDEPNEHEGHHKMEKESEIKKLKLRFLLSFIFGLPVIYMVMGGLIGLPVPEILERYGIPIQILLSTAVISACFNIWTSGFKKIIKLAPNMDSLIFIGTATAYFYSLVQAALLFSGKIIGMESFYFESAVFILVFISLGKYLEAITKCKTGNAIKK